MSSDYYYDNDPEFIQAISDAVLDGDVRLAGSAVATGVDNDSGEHYELRPSFSSQLKRARSASDDGGGDIGYHQVMHSVDAHKNADSYLSSNTYGASRFGEFGEYMTRKRAKLQIQNAELDVEGDQTNKIFRGLQIHINGWTEPSVQDLRQLIIKHGGTYHPYLDKKSLVTHIVTCSLTPAKVREFKHMKVVRPEWLVESAQAGRLLFWHDFIFKPGERIEASQGKKVVQKSLFEGFASQAASRTQPTQSQHGHASTINEATPPKPVEPVAGPSRLSRDDASTPSPPQTPKKSAADTPPRALLTTDPATPEQAARVPGYATHTSNLNAERAMADPAWRAAHTSVAPDFIEGYYKNSRLHHLSTWKAELKNLVAEAQERAESGSASTLAQLPEPGDEDSAVGRVANENLGGQGRGSGDADGVSMKGAQLMRSPSKGKGKERVVDAVERVIMHCDFDSFFVSAGLLDRPQLRGKPAVVCHSQGSQGGGSSTSEIASASYEARKFGVKSGMSLRQARKLCPTIMTIPYEFRRYKKLSLQFYTILMAHADDLQAVSVDEALIDVTSSVNSVRGEIFRSQDPNPPSTDPAKDFAEAIRAQVKKATGCEVSIGIAHNIMLARVASRRAKPAGSFHIFPHEAQEMLAPLDIDDLHGFGHSARQKALEKLGVTTLGELAKKSKAALCVALGKGMGETLYKAVRGIDDRKLESDKPRKSVSCDINYGIRFENTAQAEAFIFQMAEEVARRLDSIALRGKSLTLKIMKRDPNAPIEAPKFMGHGLCETFNKQTPIIAPGGQATSDARIIGEHAWKLLKSLNFDPQELRGIGIQIQKLENASASPIVPSGQAILPFKLKANAVRSGLSPDTKEKDVRVEASAASTVDDDVQLLGHPPAKSSEIVDLPSFSQVDMSVFEALPDDVRRELETEYTRRSATPAPQADTLGRSRSPSVFSEGMHKITVKGTNAKRIAQQLAPRSKARISPMKSTLFAKRESAVPLSVPERELKKLDIDPGVFTMLPADLQREQLAMARQAKAPGASVFSERRVLKPVGRSKSPSLPPPALPLPKAKHAEPLFLKQQGKTRGERLYFTETDDLQRVIEQWIDGFREHPPNKKDVDYFAKFLVGSVDSSRSTDVGVEKAVAVLKWWLVLLRRYFAMWENMPDQLTDGEVVLITSEVVGRSWWAAFRCVKAKMDVVARQKFGGSLSLK